MIQSNISSKEHDILFIESLIGILVLAALGLILGLFNMFYGWVFGAYLAISFTASIYYCFKKGLFLAISKELALVSIIIAIAVGLSAFNTTPTIFSGRDQGSISEAAVRLSQNHGFSFSTKISEEFFKIYGPGKALNFPGFYYTDNGKLATQFPLVYTTWLGIFYSLFGINGFIIANAILFASFLFIFYFLVRRFINPAYSLLTLLFLITSFAFSWFARFTLTENMALPLLWLMIFTLVHFLEKPRKLTYSIFILAGFLLILTRIEGVAFFSIGLVILLFNKESKKFLQGRYFKYLILPLAILSAIALFSVTKNIYFYKEIFKAFFSSWLPSNGAIKISQEKPDNSLPIFYIAQLFTIYGMMSFLLLGALGSACCFIQKKFRSLIPFFIIAPTFLYLIDSHISNDQPWMLRRYIFSILPVGIFYTSVLIYEWRLKIEKQSHALKKYLPLSLAIILIALNLPAFLNFIFYSDNKNLLKQTQQLSQNFSSNDLVLIDRTASDDGWSMLSGPMSYLYGKNSVYLFNTNDLQKIDLTKFDHIYLIAPDDRKMIYAASTIGSKLYHFKTYELSTQRLDIIPKKLPSLLISFPKKKTINVNGEIYLYKK